MEETGILEKTEQSDSCYLGLNQVGPGNVTPDPQIGQSFQVPYRLTDTNHFLVRVRINGKGPFNFLVDSGAPALYVATETILVWSPRRRTSNPRSRNPVAA